MKDTSRSKGQLIHELKLLRQRLDQLKKEAAKDERAGAQLRRVKLEYQVLLDHAPVGIWHAASDGSGVYINPRLAGIAGLSLEEAAGAGWSTALHPEDRSRVLDEWSAFIKGEADYSSTYRFQHEDGEVRWVIGSASPIKNENSTVLGFIGTITDVTDLKRAEEKLRGTLRSIGEAVVTTDTRGRITGMNPVAEKLTGWSEQEALEGTFARVFHGLKDRSRQSIANPVSEALRTGRAAVVAGHALLVAKGGDKRDISYSSAPMFDMAGTIAGVVFVFRDVTEKMRAERELAKANKLDSLGVLAGGIAHDFNNLLTALFGNIELAKEGLAPDHESYRLLESAMQSMAVATNLTSQLLTFAKGCQPVRSALSVGEVITETAQFSLRGSNVKLRSRVAPELWPVKADKAQLSQVISNLAMNAKQAMPTGGTVTIDVRNVESSEGRFVECAVRDEGIGITPQHLDKVFDPYFSTKQEGSGLGLAMCYSIIAQHNGTIEVDSRPGEGAVFTLRLPAADEEEGAGCRGPSGEARTAVGRSARVLLVDDEEAVRQVVSAMLRNMGHEVTCASDGQHAVAEYQAAYGSGAAYDVVVTDLTIPGEIGGEGVAREIRRMDPGAKIIISSGYATGPVMANHAEYGFSGVLVKPYRARSLERAIEEVLRV